MSLTKVNYIDNSTIITAKNLNDIQDNIIQNAELIKKVAPRNLLDNSDFRNPVNQRGQSSYIYGYCIDRWFFYNEGSQNPKLEVKNGYIHIEANTKHNFAQRLPLTIDTEKIYTLAYKPLIGDVVIKYRRPVISDGFCYVTPYECDTGGSIDLVWCAMYEGEYTIDTLPEYQPKGYGAELAECVRYYQRYGGEAYTKFGFGVVVTASTARVSMPILPMRITKPSCNAVGKLALDVGNNTFEVAQILLDGPSYGGLYACLAVYINGEHLTPGNAVLLQAFNSASSYIELSADL